MVADGAPDLGERLSGNAGKRHGVAEGQHGQWQRKRVGPVLEQEHPLCLCHDRGERHARKGNLGIAAFAV